MKKKLRKLRDYQKLALAYCRKIIHPALFLKMRLGKCLITIRACNWYNSKSNLINAPYSAFYGWQEELYKENETQAIELTGKREDRLNRLTEGLRQRNKWFLNSKEGHLVLPEIGSVNWESCIVDESTFIKAPAKTNTRNFYDKNEILIEVKKRFNAARFYQKNFRDVKHRFILTGTPSPESTLNYFQQLAYLNPEILGFNSYYDFLYRCYYETNTNLKNFVMRANYKKIFYKKLKENCFFMSRKRAGVGGGKVWEEREIKTTDKFKKIYKKLIKEFLLEYIDIEKEINVRKRTRFTVAKLAWLRQLCNGFIEKKLIFDFKIQEIKDLLLGELKNEPVVIWGNFIQEIKSIKEGLKDIVSVDAIYGEVKFPVRDKIVEKFNKGNLQCIVCNDEIFKFGKNLAKADVEIFNSLPWSGLTWEQAQDRLIAVEKTKDILIIILRLEKTLEKRMYTNLQMKVKGSDMLENIIMELKEEIK